MTSLLQINCLFAKMPMKAFHKFSRSRNSSLKLNGPSLVSVNISWNQQDKEI